MAFWRLPIYRSAKFIAIAVFGSGVLLSLAGGMLLQHVIRRDAALKFQSLIDNAATEIQQRLNRPIYGMRGARGLFDASQHANQRVRRQEFRQFFERRILAKEFPGVRGFGFIQRVERDELDAFLAAERADDAPDFRFRQLADTSQSDAYVIKFLEPSANNAGAQGLDIGSEPLRRLAAKQAVETGEVVMTGAITLVQDNKKTPGVLVFLPVYARALPVESVEARRAALIGLVYVPIVINEILAKLDAVAAAQIEIELMDPESGNRLFESLVKPEASAKIGTQLARGKLNGRESLPIFGRDLELRVASTPIFDAAFAEHQVWTLTGTGTLISLMLALLLYQQATARRRAEKAALGMTEELRKMAQVAEHNASLLRGSIDVVGEAFVLFDHEDKLLLCNEKYRKIATLSELEIVVGMSVDEVVKRGAKSIRQEDSEASIEAWIAQRLALFYSGDASFVQRLTDGRAMRIVERKMDNGHTVSFHTDITELLQATQTATDALASLHVSEERFDLAIQGADDGLWDFDMQTNRAYYSPRWKSMLGYAEDEISDAQVEWSSRVHPDELAQVERAAFACLRGETERYRKEFRMRHKAGHYVWILARGMVSRDEHGKGQRFVGIHSDISAQKEVEHIKTEFVSVVSHELRTPLTSIRGSLGLLESGVMGQMSAKALALVQVANRNSQRLIGIVNDILDMEKLLSGKMTMRLVALDLNEMARQAIEVNAGYAENLKVSFALSPSLPPCWAAGDADRLMQVMANLLSNAAKFSKPFGVIAVRIIPGATMHRVEVEDHGAGIPLNFQNRIFEAFAQADSGDTRQQGGTGLGLNISKKMVEQMQGSMGFSSVEGQGTCFWFAIPVGLAPASVSVPAPA